MKGNNEYYNGNNLTKDDLALDILSKAIKRGNVKDGRIYIPDINLFIEVRVNKSTENIAESIFTITHELIEEPIVESIIAIGDSSYECIEKTIDLFLMGTLYAITTGLRGKNGVDIQSKLYDRINRFKFYRSYRTTLGEKTNGDSIEFWKVLGSEITKRLGNKKAQWVKIQGVKTRSTVLGECIINGVVNEELSTIIKLLANYWEIKGEIYSEKQFFFFIEDENSYIPYNYSKTDIREYVKEIIRYYGKCDTTEKYNRLSFDTFKITGEKKLSMEIYYFIPEILCELICEGVDFRDELEMSSDYLTCTIYKGQIPSYDYIKETLKDYLNKNKLNRTEMVNILRYSAQMKSINEALDSGMKMKDLVMEKIKYKVFNEYRPY